METPLFLQLQCFLIGVLGLLFHLFKMKIPAVKSRAEAAGIPFSLKYYLKTDYLSIIASFIALLIVVLLFDEIIGYRPSIIKWVKFFFAFVGYTGSSLLIGAFGKADKAIKDVVDIKTNELDSIKNN